MDSMLMKKWWLKKTLADGRRLAGWINTEAERKECFPEKICGKFWTERDAEGTHGTFELDHDNKPDQYTFVYVYTASVELNHKMFTGKSTRQYFKSVSPLDTWERTGLRIENCLNLDKTYIDKI
jgi:hypothetical protein